MIHETSYKRMAQAILAVGPLTSLAVSPDTNFDPINLIKLLVISSIAFYCFGLILSSLKYSLNRLSLTFWICSVLFFMSMISSLILSGAPLAQQVWGTFGRNSGLLTYLSFLLILISTALIQNVKFYHRLINSLLIAALPMTLYCLIQYFKMDPISWSEKNTFGTLGNINFSSAFFGFSSICAVAMSFQKKLSKGIRLGLLFLVLIDLFIVLSTGSIQGIMVFVAGVGLIGYLYLRSNIKTWTLRISYVFLVLIGVILTIFGLSNKGPLAKFLFAPSIVFRTDYWHAGWQMTLDHPFFGVGLDSYGDWYRSTRGLISTLRTGPDRVANTAHNIFLDISSNGGLPLIAAYLAINIIAFSAAIKVLRRITIFQPYFAALFATWIGYLIFSAISINQMGVGIWGWLFTGALIGYEVSTRESSTSTPIDVRKGRPKKKLTLSPLAGMLGFVGLLLGFVLAFIPFNADMKYRNATKSAAMDQIIKSTKILGSTAFHNELALDTALKNNFPKEIDVLTRQLVKNYPLDFMGWRSLQVLPTATQDEKSIALAKLNELDPFNPDIPKS